MANEIVIQVTLETDEIGRAGQEISRKLNNALNLGRNVALERERAHALRVAQIYAQSAAQLEAIERRKQAQIEVIRERAFQQEQSRLKRLESAAQASAQRIGSAFRAIAGLVPGLGVAGLVGSAISKAFDVDAQRVQLAAFVGGIDNANKKLAEFSKIAQVTAGVTRDRLTASFIDLKAQARLTDEQATKLAVSLTKLQALFPKAQNTAQNLAQIFNQRFELGDVKQERGQTGDFIDKVIERLGFTGSNALKQIRAAQKHGKLTQDAFWNAVNDEVIARSANLTETLEVRMAKATEATAQKMAELGDKLLKDIIPAMEKLLKLLNPMLDFFNKLPEAVKLATLSVLAFGPSILRLTDALFGLRVAAVALGGFLTGPGGIALLALLGLGTAAFALNDLIKNKIPANVRNALNLPGDRSLLDLPPDPNAPTKLEGPADKRFAGLNLETLRNSLNRKKNQGVDLDDEDIRKARALREAQLSFAKSEAENEIRLLKDANDRQLRDLKQSYEDRKIAVEQYHEFTRNIQLSTLNAELKILEQNEAQLRHNINLATGPERIKIQKELNDVLTEEKLKRGEINDVIAATTRALELEARAQKARLAEQREIRRTITRESDRELAAFMSSRLLEQRETRVKLTRESDERAAAELQRTSRRALTRSGAFIEEAFNRGRLTPEQAEQLNQVAARDFAGQLRQVLEIESRRGDASKERLDDLRDEIDLYDRLGSAVSNTDRFFHGFNSQIETTGAIFDRLGQNVARAFTNIKDLFSGLKSAVLDFVNSLLARNIQNLLSQTLGPLLGGLGGVFGGLGGAGGAGGTGRTPPTFPASAFSSIINAFGGGGGGRLVAPPSLSQGFNFFGSSGPTSAITSSGSFVNIRNPFATGGGGALNAVIGGSAASKFSFGALGKSLGPLAPLLGLSLGAGLGGQSIGGQILGGIGGALGGLVAGTALAGGSLGSLGTLFSLSGALGPAALIAAPLLIAGGILLGKAKQRHQDEEASGVMLKQALDGIDQLAAGISSDQIDGAQARSIFDTQILATFQQQIRTLKTKSVVESRLKNQVRDLNAVYEARIPPLIADQQTRRANQASFAAIDRRLVPQFAIGGISSGGLAVLHPNEMVLTPGHQAMLRLIGGNDVFERIGVPGVQQKAVFDNGGIMPAGAPAASSGPTTINLYVGVGVTQEDAQQIVAYGLGGRTGENIVIDKIERARIRGRRV
jgi:hypothetical protein